MKKALLFIAAFISLWSGNEIFARQQSASDSKSDSTQVRFLFMKRSLTFMSPFEENAPLIDSLHALLNGNREAITGGEAYVSVRGYCGSYQTQERNLEVAKVMSNQVKSWYITHGWMKEEYYVTRNTDSFIDGENAVMVSVRHYAREAVPQQEQTTPEVTPQPQPQPQPEPQPEPEPKSEPQPEPEPEAAPAAAPERTGKNIPVALKTNMLSDVILLPQLEIEYRFADDWSVALEGSMAWWSSNSKHIYDQLAYISPEVRWWFGKKEHWHGHYIGLFGSVGLYDLEYKKTGYQGEFWMTGLSYGYMFPISRSLSLEAGIGVGFLRTGYREYEPIDHCYVYQRTANTNFVGPLKAKLSLVWRLGDKKGGDR